MEIIPAIDLINGKCVRLTEGDYSTQKIYAEDPVAMAQTFEDAGLQRLHLVDLEGAKQGKIIEWKLIEKIASKTSLKIDFGGGVKTAEDVQLILDAGASFVTIGSIAVKNENLVLGWFQKFGAGKFILGVDVKAKAIYIQGWTEKTTLHWEGFMENYIQQGVQQIFCTDISKDGKLAGPSIDLYKKIISRFPNLFFIASGGVASIEDLVALADIGCKGAIVGKAIYEHRIELKALEIFL